jgi:hypothetical protein
MRLRDAVLKVPMTPAQAGISAYLNSILASARLDALVEFLTSPPNATWTAAQAIDAGVIRALRAKAEVFEAQVSRIQVASGALPSIIAKAN